MGTDMRRIVLLIAFTMGSLGLQSLKATPLAQPMPETKSKANENTRFANEDAFFKYLKPILKSTGSAARIYYLGSCEKEGDYYMVSFPRVRVQSPLGNDTGLAAIRDVFRNDANVKVSEGTDGIVRIEIGQLPAKVATILDTRISVVNFDQAQQYTEKQALTRIQSSTEVREARRRLGTQPDGIPLYMSAVKQPVEGAPHLPTSMVNLTWDQALDSVAKTFGGVVLYGTCVTQNLYTVDYVSIRS
jgi:hypothetical protein